MKKNFLLLTVALLCAVVQRAWAQTEVSTEEALRTVINENGSNKSVKMTADIQLGSRLVIENGKNVTLDLNGHKLLRSLTAAADDGNVIFVETGGQLTVKDSGNNSGQITGGKAINGGGICNHGTLTFEGGTITGCSASTNGGGIYNAPETSGAVSMTIKGGSITGNTCGDRGAGIFNYSGCYLYIQGTVDVSGNTKGSEANNVYLDGETVFTVTGALTGSTIGVSIAQNCRTITSGYKANNPTTDGAAFFSSDNSQFGIAQNGDEMFFGRSATFNVRSWDETSKQVVTTQVTKVSTPIEGNNPDGWITLTNGYYMVTGNVEYQALTIVGSDVHLILADGCKLNCRHIKLEQGNSLHIHSESDGDNKGQLYAENNTKTGTYFDGAAAIGGGNEQNSGSLYVHGGYVKAWVDANTLYHGDAGIGGGKKHGIGGEVVIYGGKVDAIGDSGAGIGGGDDGNQGGRVIIYGGDVSAEAQQGGAGIGGGDLHDGGSVYIYGGNVSANGGNLFRLSGDGDGNTTELYGAGIGGGRNNYAGALHIYGGTVKPAGGNRSQCVTGSVEIVTGMRVTTKHGPVAAADRVKTCYITGSSNDLTIFPCSHDGNFIYTIIDDTKHSRVCEYCGVTVEEAHTYTDGVCVCGQRYADTLAEVTLTDAQDNTTTLTSNNGKVVNVTLDGRTLYKDGSWNTLCLPFDVADIYDTPLASLEGVIVKTLSSSDYDGTTKTLTLNFGEATSSLKAGVPYIIKWNTTGDPINRPRFECVTISNTLTSVTTDYVNFVGSFSPVTLTSGDKSVLYLGADSKLYYPSSDKTVNSCRAVFRLKGIEAGDLPQQARRFVLNFGDGETTRITLVDGSGFGVNGSDAWYTIDGRRLNGKPATRGLYINNGNKVVIK